MGYFESLVEHYKALIIANDYKLRGTIMTKRLTEQEIIEKLSNSFNNVTLINYTGDRTYRDYHFSATCKYCGKYISPRRIGRHYADGRILSCGCLQNKHGNNSSNWRGSYDGVVYGSHYCHISASAHKRDIEFDISIEDISKLLIKQDGKCIYTGLDIVSAYLVKDRSASLDRIDSSKGYTKDNIQWVHKDINFMKRGFNEKYFLSLADAVNSKQQINSIDEFFVPLNSLFGLTVIWKREAGRRSLSWQVSDDFIKYLYNKQFGRCSLSGAYLVPPKTYGDVSSNISLDRIDSSGNYTEDNVQLVIKDINLMKWRLNQSLFLNYCKLIKEHYLEQLL